jgi:hypothetical protein
MKNVELIEWSRRRATRGFTRCSPASRHTRLRPLVLAPRLAPHAASPACSPASPRATRGFAACSPASPRATRGFARLFSRHTRLRRLFSRLASRHTRLYPLVLSPLCSPACNCRTPPSVISRGYYGRLQNVAASQGDTVNPPQPPFFSLRPLESRLVSDRPVLEFSLRPWQVSPPNNFFFLPSLFLLQRRDCLI